MCTADGRYWRPRGLRGSVAARLVGLWVRMAVSLVSVVCCQVGLIRRPEESYRVLHGVTITLYTYSEQTEEARLTEKERMEESNADKHQDTGQK